MHYAEHEYLQVIKKALSKGNIDDMRSDSEPSEDESVSGDKKDK